VTTLEPLPSPDISAPALHAVVARLGADVAAPLTAALDRLLAIAQSGHLDGAGLKALRQHIGQARDAGLRAQQIGRLVAGDIHLVPERLNLATALRQVLTEQAAQPGAQAHLGQSEQLVDVDVLADPSLLATLLRAAADWCRDHAQAPLQWRLVVQADTAEAVLTCEVGHRHDDPTATATADGTGSAGSPETTMVASDGPRRWAALDTLDWLVLSCAATLAQVRVERHDSPGRSLLRLWFSATPGEAAGAARLAGGRLVAGSQVLVLATGREARQRVREAMQGHDVFIDMVTTVEAARDYCDDGAPQVLIFESAFISEALRTLCERLGRLQPGVALIELLPSGQDMEPGAIGTVAIMRLGADALRQTLAATLARALAPTPAR
jgi:hypothetical protein